MKGESRREEWRGWSWSTCHGPPQDGDTPVIGDLGGDIVDESRIADSAFAVEDPLVGSWFPLLHYTDDLQQLVFFKALSL
jgi:hypothetical protein